MKLMLLFFLLSSVLLFESCNNPRNKKSGEKEGINYSNRTVLDSLIKVTPLSKDTLFLGFTIGMTKDGYKNHIHRLRKEGKVISYSQSNKYSNLVGGTFELGAGYTFKTKISAEKQDKKLTGEGEYFLEPIYNNNGNLMQLNILPIEKWNEDYGFGKPSWLEMKIRENSKQFKNKKLKQTLIDNEFINKYDFIRQKGSLVIYKTDIILRYIDFKRLLLELLNKQKKKAAIKENNENIKF